MDYKTQISVFSASVLHLGTEEDDGIGSLLTPETADRINIYRNNLFFGALKRLTEDFPGTCLYLGENNFQFFVRKYLLDRPLKSPNLMDLSRGFVPFLSDNQDIHQDDFVSSFGAIDLLWSHGQDGDSCTIATGVFSYWHRICTEQSGDDLAVDFGSTEIVIVRDNGHEKNLVLKQSLA